MSVMGFKKKAWMGWVGGWVELYHATDCSTMYSLFVEEQSEFLSSKIHEYIDLCNYMS